MSLNELKRDSSQKIETKKSLQNFGMLLSDFTKL